MKQHNTKTAIVLVVSVFGLCAAIATAETVSVQNYLYEEGVAQYQRRTMFVIGNFREPTRLEPPTLSLPNGLRLRSVDITPPRTTVIQNDLLVPNLKQKKEVIPVVKKQVRVEKNGVASPVKTVRDKVKSQEKGLPVLPTVKVVASVKDSTIVSDARPVRVGPKVETKKPVVSLQNEAKPQTKIKPSVKAKRQKMSSMKTPVPVKVVKATKSPKKNSMKVKSATKTSLKGCCEAPTVQFKWASTWVHPKTASGLVKRLMLCGVKKVRVVGFTCDLGNKRVNDRMALGRAEVVAKILRKKGFEVVEVSGKGKSDYLTHDPKKRKLNRRVEVQISG